MSWFGPSSSIDPQVEKATDSSVPFGETDLAASLEVSDLIRSKTVAPKEAMRSLKRRLTATKNPNTQMATLHLIDTCVKNGGAHFIQEMATREFMDCLVGLIHEDRTNESVRDLALDLVQSWATALKDNVQWKNVWTTYQHLKDDGYSFPVIGAPVSSTLFDSSAPPEWEDSDACMICSTAFGMINRKHHCRNCGGVYCQTHSSKSMELEHLGITEPVRVCDTCYDEIRYKKKSSKKSRRSKHQKDVSHARAQYDSDDDDDLKRALELSLRESQGYQPEPVRFVQQPQPVQKSASAEDEDEEMKAVIAASLAEFEQEKQRQQPQQQPPQNESPYSNLLPATSGFQQPAQQSPQTQLFPANYITAQDSAEILQFASKVGQSRGNPYDNPELIQYYRQAMPLTPKLASDLHESMTKHDELVAMNQKVDMIMRMYNSLLDRRIERENQQRNYAAAPSYPPFQSYQQAQSLSAQPTYQQPQSLSAQSTYQPSEPESLSVQPPYQPSQSYRQPSQYQYVPQNVPQASYQPQVTPVAPVSPYPTNSYPEIHNVAYEEEEKEEEEEEGGEEEFSAPPSQNPAQATQSPPLANVQSPQPQHIQSQQFPAQDLSPTPAHHLPVQQRPQQAVPKITDFSFPSVPSSRPPAQEPAQLVPTQPKEEALIEL